MDNPSARGQFGRGGVAIDTVHDMHTLTAAFDPEPTFLSSVAMGTAPLLFAAYCESSQHEDRAWSPCPQ